MLDFSKNIKFTSIYLSTNFYKYFSNIFLEVKLIKTGRRNFYN